MRTTTKTILALIAATVALLAMGGVAAAQSPPAKAQVAIDAGAATGRGADRAITKLLRDAEPTALPPSNSPLKAARSGSSAFAGTVTTSSGRQAGASIYLHRYSGNSWVSLGKKATTNSSGNYAISGVWANYYHQVQAAKAYGGCEIGYFAVYSGYSKVILTRTGTTHNAPIRMNFLGYVYC